MNTFFELCISQLTCRLLHSLTVLYRVHVVKNLNLIYWTDFCIALNGNVLQMVEVSLTSLFKKST